MATERRGSVDQLKSPGNPSGEDSMAKTKSFAISKREVWEAWKIVRSNKGGPGIDDQTIEAFEQNITGNLYKLWNRMASGSYMPKGVKRVEIPKPDGSTRPLGIPCVFDRIAQTVVKRKLEPELEQVFCDSSYGPTGPRNSPLWRRVRIAGATLGWWTLTSSRFSMKSTTTY